MEAGFSPNAGMPAPTGGQDLIGTVSAISNSLMGEVSKVIIGKNENLRRVTEVYYPTVTCSLRTFQDWQKHYLQIHSLEPWAVNSSEFSLPLTFCHLTLWGPTCMTKSLVSSS